MVFRVVVWSQITMRDSNKIAVGSAGVSEYCAERETARWTRERENGRDESGPASAAAVLPLAAEPVEARGAFNDARYYSG
jgi:hypothetical protein